MTLRQIKAAAVRAEDGDDLTRAEEALTKAFVLDRTDGDIAVRLFRTLASTGKLSAALELAEHSFSAGVVNPRLAGMYVIADFRAYAIADSLPDVSAKLARHPRLAIVRGRAAIAYAWHGDAEKARVHARAAILGADSAETASVIRLAIARRALNFGHSELADWVCRVGRAGATREADILYDRLVIRTGNAANDDVTARLFRRLLKIEDFPRRAELVSQHVDFLWRFNGPSIGLLDEIDAHLAATPGDANLPLILMKTALALQLGDEDRAVAALESRPALFRKVSACLPVAKLVHKYRLGDGNEPQAAAYAALYDELADSESLLKERFGDADQSCAVVGNSPCEIGRGHGERIDAHDEVVRFNRFNTAPPFDRDYGTRVTTLVRIGVDKTEIGVDLPPETLIVISSGSILYRGRAWRAAMRMREQGHQLCVFPQRIHTELSRRVVGSPSSGLSFVYLLKALRGRLRREDFFGFAFTDQIGPNAASSHYFEAAKASTVHKWTEERRIFDSLFEDAAT